MSSIFGLGQPGKAPKDTAATRYTSSSSVSPGGGFVADYGGAITNGLATMFAARSASRAQRDQSKYSKEEAALQRTFTVDDNAYKRKTQLEDKSYRQTLLNPYAGYNKGA